MDWGPKHTLVFLHLPKTGGITMSRLLVRNYSPSEVFHVRKPYPPGAPRFSRYHGPVEDFAGLPESRRAEFRCVLGHMDFGIHEHVPGPCRYITLVRRPVDRVLSHYRQHQRMVANRDLNDGQKLTIEEYLEQFPSAFRNHQIRFVSGWHGFDVEHRKEALARAIQNLRTHFLIAGTLERFDETLFLLGSLAEWKDIRYVRANVSHERPEADAAGTDLIRRIEEANQEDQELHAEANRLLDQAIRAYGPRFTEGLDQFRTANQAYQRRHWGGELGRRVVGRLWRSLMNTLRRAPK